MALTHDPTQLTCKFVVCPSKSFSEENPTCHIPWQVWLYDSQNAVDTHLGLGLAKTVTGGKYVECFMIRSITCPLPLPFKQCKKTETYEINFQNATTKTVTMHSESPSIIWNAPSTSFGLSPGEVDILFEFHLWARYGDLQLAPRDFSPAQRMVITRHITGRNQRSWWNWSQASGRLKD